jgi:hypothetical protein
MTDHADVGYLTWSDFDRFRAAIHRSMIIVPWLHAAGYIKGEVNEIRSPSSDHPLGLPPTWLAAEEISRLSGELRYWADLEDVANDDYGSGVARQFTREVETASARWPIEDKARPVRHLRCQSCSGETIRYDPPRYQDDTVKIACTECARVYTDEEFSTLVELVAAEMKRAEVKVGSTRRLGAA